MRQRIELDLSSPVEHISPRPALSVRDILRVANRHRFKMSIFFVASIASAVLFLLLVKKNYVSESVLFLRLGRENSTLDATATLGQGAVIVQPFTRDNEMNSVAEILRSRALIEKVVDAVGPAALLGTAPPATAGSHASDSAKSAPVQQRPTGNPAAPAGMKSWLGALNPLDSTDEREKAIEKATRNLRVEAVSHSNVIEVSYRGYSPQTAQAVVAKLVDLYLKEHVRLNRTDGARDLLSEQANRLSSALAASEKELHDLLNQRALVSSDGRRDSLDKNLSLTEEALREALASQAASEAQVQALTGALAALPKLEVTGKTTGISDYGTDLMRGQLYALVLREKELASKYTDQYDELRHVRAQLREAQEAIDREAKSHTQETSGKGRSFEEIQLALVKENANLASLRAKVKSLNEQVAQIRSEMAAFNDTSFRIRSLQRQIDMREREYRKYSEALEQARLDEAMEGQRISNVSVVQPATLEPTPSFPRPLLCFAVALGVGICGAISLAYYSEYVDSTLLAPADAQDHVGLPLLGAVPILRPATDNGTRPTSVRS